MYSVYIHIYGSVPMFMTESCWLLTEPFVTCYSLSHTLIYYKLFMITYTFTPLLYCTVCTLPYIHISQSVVISGRHEVHPDKKKYENFNISMFYVISSSKHSLTEHIKTEHWLAETLSEHRIWPRVGIVSGKNVANLWTKCFIPYSNFKTDIGLSQTVLAIPIIL